MTRMALGITDKHAVVQGMPLVQGNDEYFWFRRPQLILHLMHFALFQVLKRIIVITLHNNKPQVLSFSDDDSIVFSFFAERVSDYIFLLDMGNLTQLISYIFLCAIHTEND